MRRARGQREGQGVGATVKLRLLALFVGLVAIAVWVWGRDLDRVKARPAPTFDAAPIVAAKPVPSRARNLGLAPQVPSKKKLPERMAMRQLCVRDAQGEAVPELGIVLYCSTTSALMPGGSIITDQEGCASTRLCADPAALTCARVAGASHRPAGDWILDPASTSYTLALAAGAVVSGQVQDETGSALTGAKLWFEAHDPDRWSAPPFVQMRLQSDATGHYRFVAARPLPCDPCVRDEQDCENTRRIDDPDAPIPGTIWIRHPEHGLQAVAMPQTWGVMEPVVMDGQRSVVQGRLSGAGAQGAKLMLRHRVRRRDRQVQTTDAGGHFEFSGLGSGDYELSVFSDKKRVLQEFPVRAGDELSLSLAQGLDPRP